MKPEFKFAYDYDEALKELQVDNDNDIVAQFWPEKNAAAQCIRTIRYRNRQIILSVAVSTETLEIDDDMQYIIVNQDKKAFLRFDNQDKTGNRILIFFSDKGAEIMQVAKEWHMDGTFKNCPKIFKQLLTVQCIIKNEAFNVAYMLLQNKTRDAYTAAFTGMRNACIYVFAPTIILLDFEVAMQQACISVFLLVQIKGIYKINYCLKSFLGQKLLSLSKRLLVSFLTVYFTESCNTRFEKLVLF